MMTAQYAKDLMISQIINGTCDADFDTTIGTLTEGDESATRDSFVLLAYELSIVIKTPVEARNASIFMQRLACNVLVFNLGEAEASQAAIDAAYDVGV